ncbi:hypothetical protein ACOMHN_008289 [Nucella lapillus]
MLNSVDNPKSWTTDDIARAHRTGQSRDGQPRPMIVKFNRWRDKMVILTNKDNRQKLHDKGVRVANDLTKAQAQIVATARKEGRRAYFQRGQLVIGPAPTDPRSYAQVVEGGSTQHASSPVFPTRPTQRGDLDSRAAVTSDSDITAGSGKAGASSPSPPPHPLLQVQRAGLKAATGAAPMVEGWLLAVDVTGQPQSAGVPLGVT